MRVTARHQRGSPRATAPRARQRTCSPPLAPRLGLVPFDRRSTTALHDVGSGRAARGGPHDRRQGRSRRSWTAAMTCPPQPAMSSGNGSRPGTESSQWPRAPRPTSRSPQPLTSATSRPPPALRPQRASLPLAAAAAGVVAIGVVLPLTPLAGMLGFQALPPFPHRPRGHGRHVFDPGRRRQARLLRPCRSRASAGWTLAGTAPPPRAHGEPLHTCWPTAFARGPEHAEASGLPSLS
jgi:hypothetical protein